MFEISVLFSYLQTSSDVRNCVINIFKKRFSRCSPVSVIIVMKTSVRLLFSNFSLRNVSCHVIYLLNFRSNAKCVFSFKLNFSVIIVSFDMRVSEVKFCVIFIHNIVSSNIFV
jgi:hypothetical protein